MPCAAVCMLQLELGSNSWSSDPDIQVSPVPEKAYPPEAPGPPPLQSHLCSAGEQIESLGTKETLQGCLSDAVWSLEIESLFAAVKK